MRLKEFLEENIYYGFSAADNDTKLKILDRDLRNLGIEYDMVSADSDDYVPGKAFILSIKCSDNHNAEHTFRQVKRLLLSAGWMELAYSGDNLEVELVKRSIRITLSRKSMVFCTVLIYVK